MSTVDQSLMYASQRRLIWLKFKKHRLALGSVGVLGLLYIVVFLAHYLTPYDPAERHTKRAHAPPQRVRVIHDGQLSRPFVYAYSQVRDERTLDWIYGVDRAKRIPIEFFVRGYRYKFLDLFWTDRHLFGVSEEGTIHLLGTDDLGRDFLSRMLIGGQISLSIGLIGVTLSFVVGLTLGGISGFYGGAVDMAIQRVIELLISIPTLPLWMGLAAAVPASWPATRIYLMMTIILSLVSWTGLARVVRGKVISVREEDFVMAARLCGAQEGWIIQRHLIPSMYSYIIVSLTMAIPRMIMGETALSFLGLGLQPPALSWGVLLQRAQNVRSIALYPWLLSPAIMVVLVVLCFNFVGDGLRDAADPYVR